MERGWPSPELQWRAQAGPQDTWNERWCRAVGGSINMVKSAHNCTLKVEVQEGHQVQSWGDTGDQESLSLERKKSFWYRRRQGSRAVTWLASLHQPAVCNGHLPHPSEQRQGAVRSSQVHLNCHLLSQPWSLSCVQYAFPFLKKSEKQHL